MSAVLAFNTFWGSPCSHLGCLHRTLLPSLPMLLELCSREEGTREDLPSSHQH